MATEPRDALEAEAREVAKGLTSQCKAALTWPKPGDDGGVRIQCRTLYPATISALERRKLVQFNCLTKLGLAVRSHLLAALSAAAPGKEG
ncbi:hypothetical protein [Sphingomonas xinjiangensis]|uniref:Uncharacterized protein n=1 Tax=Sphingomonas xinjiangensis TaxID=643568 RepID=A0A840YEU2_9SPHN|nr:hypothetical protein [Sphingomonas xinjiangensis]MBB5709288.1 hypothetical protein [Sphingomonas xinjiangensis]